MKLTAALFLASAQSAFACDAFVIHAASYHTDRDAIVDVQEINPGYGCRTGHVEVGVYMNSYADTSVYAVYDTSYDGFSVFAGAASGYEDDIYSFTGMMPVLGVAYHGDAVTVRATPTYADEKLGVTFGLSFVIGGQS